MIHSLFLVVKTLCYGLDFILHTFLLYLLASVFPLIEKEAQGDPQKRGWLTRRYRAYFRYWCWSFSRFLGVSLCPYQHYAKKLPPHYIVIANHPSAYEDIGMSALFPVRFLAKKEVRSWWIVGKIGAAAGTLYVDREDKNDRQKAAAALEAAVLAGDNIGLYPEGGCKGRRLSLPFYKGAFHCSWNTGVPILPVYLEYPAQEDFEWHEQTLIQKLWCILGSHNKNVYYHIFEAVAPQDFSDVESYIQEIEKRYQQWQDRFL